MDENKTYSAEDLLRYAHGQMPAAERYALEKAALEDPFLAEALDGYLEAIGNAPQITTIPQLEEVRKVITKKAADKKEKKLAPVIFITANKWLQRALAAIIIIGAAWWLYSISNRPKENIIIAKTEQVAQIQPPAITDSVVAVAAPKQEQTVVLANKATSKQAEVSSKSVEAAPGIAKANEVLADKIAPAVAPIAVADSANTSKYLSVDEKKFSTSENNLYKKELSQRIVVGYGTQRKAEPELQNVSVAKKPSFVFQGRVLDINNNPLPFSSVMVPGENFGTYSDRQGYFNFVYTDSVLPVHAKSIGFEAQDFSMRSNTKENRIVLNEDKNLTFFQSEKQKTRAGFLPTIVKLDTISSNVEPYVGWNNYGLYLANNNRISDFQLSASNNTNKSVLLSFDVAEDGGIKNITVDKSQGKDLDAEAIRLLKEGPKWKVKKNGEKGKVEVKF